MEPIAKGYKGMGKLQKIEKVSHRLKNLRETKKYTDFTPCDPIRSLYISNMYYLNVITVAAIITVP